MKKLLILLLGLCLALAGCGGPMGGAPDSQRPDGFFSRLEQIEYADGTDTAIDFSVSGHMEKGFTFQCSVWEGSFDAKFSGAVSGAVNGKVSSAGIMSDIRNMLTPPQAPEAGEGDDIIPSPSGNGARDFCLEVALSEFSSLFNLNDQTVRQITAVDGKDNTVTYEVDVYEGQVKSALPILKEEFEKIVDVQYLRITLTAMGTKTEVSLKLKVLYRGESAPTEIFLFLTHTQTVKVID